MAMQHCICKSCGRAISVICAHTTLSTQNKLEAEQAEAFVTISTLQEERVELLALKDALQKYIRQLEQNNDDLERGKR